MRLRIYKGIAALLLLVYFSPLIGLHLHHGSSVNGEETDLFEFIVHNEDSDDHSSEAGSHDTAPETLIGHILKDRGRLSNENPVISHVDLSLIYVSFENFFNNEINLSRYTIEDFLPLIPISFILETSSVRGPPNSLN